jgi:acyl dehydratase
MAVKLLKYLPSIQKSTITMSKLVINSYKDFEQYVGKELGVSDYLKITQEHINKFAEATLDFQWIHLDIERAKVESPYKTTIAHGYLTLSVIPYLWGQIVEVNNLKMTVNYGIENLRFNQPVLVDSEVRVRAKLNSLIDLRGVTKAKINVVLEISANKKSALDATIVFLYHFI